MVFKRNDIFYIFSFNIDYYLVFVVFYNRIERLRMFLFMSVLFLNDLVRLLFGKVGMIQIDCGVKKIEFINMQKFMFLNLLLQQNMIYFSGYGGI